MNAAHPSTGFRQNRPAAAETPASTARVQLSGHLPGLDGVRGLAILMVLATHFVGGATANTLLQRLVVKAAGYGLLGVDLFFVLSGFLITGLLIRAKGRPNYFRNFYARRTLRIFPLYYGVLAGLFLILPRLTTVTPMLAEAAKHQAWLWTYTSNFYLAYVSDWNTLTYVNHFWSLAVEEHFYLLWPLVVFTFSRPTLERICIGVILAGLALRTGLAWNGMSELAISVLTPCRVDSLCAGGLLALVAHRDAGAGAERLVARARPAALWLGGLIVAVSAWCALTDIGVITLHQVRDSLYALFFGAVVLLSLQPGSSLMARAFRNSVLRFLGKYSYGLYVYHAILLWYFTETHVEGRFDAWLGNHALAMVAVAVTGTAISVAIAVISFHLFEKHLLSLKRFFETDMSEGRRGRPVAAAGR